MAHYTGRFLKSHRISNLPSTNAQSGKLSKDGRSSGWIRLTDATTIATLTLLALLALAAWRMRPKRLTKEFDDALDEWVDETKFPAGQ